MTPAPCTAQLTYFNVTKPQEKNGTHVAVAGRLPAGLTIGKQGVPSFASLRDQPLNGPFYTPQHCKCIAFIWCSFSQLTHQLNNHQYLSRSTSWPIAAVLVVPTALRRWSNVLWERGRGIHLIRFSSYPLKFIWLILWEPSLYFVFIAVTKIRFHHKWSHIIINVTETQVLPNTQTLLQTGGQT